MNFEEILLLLARTIAGFAVVLGVWVFIQNIIRSQTGCSHDKDPLDYMPNGCAGCRNADKCRKRKEEKHHHELA